MCISAQNLNHVYFKIYSISFLLTYYSICVSIAFSTLENNIFTHGYILFLSLWCLFLLLVLVFLIHSLIWGWIPWSLYCSYSSLCLKFIMYFARWWFINFSLEHLELSTPTKFHIKIFQLLTFLYSFPFVVTFLLNILSLCIMVAHFRRGAHFILEGRKEDDIAPQDLGTILL